MANEKIENRRVYSQKISKLYNLCIELGIHGARVDANYNEKEINRFTDAIKQHCEERDLTLDSYVAILTYNVEKRRKEIEENNKGNRIESEYDPWYMKDPNDVDDAEIDDGYFDNCWNEDET